MKIKTIIILMATLAAASCSQDSPSSREDGSVALKFNIRLPEVATQGNAGTRSTVGPIMPDVSISSFSLCVIPEQTANTSWYHDNLGYDNLNGKPIWNSNSFTGLYTFTSCSFLPRGTTTTLSYLGLFPTKGSVWIYGVYPSILDFENYINDLEHIPYTTAETNVANNYDYMYIDPIYVDMAGLKPGDVQARDITFKHVMTAVELRLTTTHIGTVMVDSIHLAAYDCTEKAAVFSMEGTYSAKDGSVTPLSGKYADHLSISFNRTLGYKYDGTSSRRYSHFPFIFPAVAHKPGRKLIATIHFKPIGSDGHDLVGQTCTMEFDFDNIETDGVRKGLAPGYRYAYRAEIDNFIKYSGYPEVEEWVVPTDDPDDEQVKDIVI